MRQATERAMGARALDAHRCEFRVWAPEQSAMAVRLVADRDRVIPLQPEPGGYHAAIVADAPPGTRYLWRFPDGRERPDPASRYQPEGVHGPSQVVAPYTAWTASAWRGPLLRDYIIYELHIGTFTPAGTFDAVIPRLADLVDLGVTAVEIMPIAEFPGARNWGYDGVDLFAAHSAYGGLEGFARLVDACHAHGLAVALDVVYNHLGPEGNYLGEFGPYFTSKYRTPWGGALNYDDAHSDAVRSFFIQNALQWVEEFHVDALRLDAIHAITDFSAAPFLAELAAAVHAVGERAGRNVYVIGESDLNDARVVTPRDHNGLGLDGQWSDDLHHTLHALLTGERDGYYTDFGDIEQLARALRQSYVYAGDYSAFRRRRHGNSPQDIPAERFVVCSQNHDQVGNRMSGDRLSQLVDPARLRLAAGVVLLSPYIPLLFMGEEYGETQPFQYFVSHGDPALVQAVREGRRAEFAAFAQEGEAPDPQDEATFQRSKLRPEIAQDGWHAELRRLYQQLIQARKTLPALAHLSKDDQEVTAFPKHHIITQRRWHDTSETFAIYHFGATPAIMELPMPPGQWELVIDSSISSLHATISPLHAKHGEGLGVGPLAPHSFRLYQRTHERIA